MIKKLFLLLLPIILFGQSSFFGYYEGEFDQLKFANQTYNYGYNKLRLDFEARPDDAITIGANINIQKYYDNTSWNLLDFLPSNIWQPIFQPEGVPEEKWINEFPIALSDTLFLDNVYLKTGFKHFDLTVGKQQISLGTGYAWNPTDIFNTKQLLDPTYEQTGVNAIRAEILLNGRTGLDVILSPGKDWNESVKMLQLKTGLGRFDMQGTIGQYTWQRTQFNPITFSIDEQNNLRTLYGGSIVGELAGAGVWIEGAWNQMGNQEDFTEVVIGTDYTFKNGLYIIMEYLRNENGVSSSDNLNIDHYLQYFMGETHSLMQDYLFGFLSYPINDFIQFGLLGFGNLNDNSAALNPQISWNLFQDVDLTMMYSHFIGDGNTEFGVQDWGWRIRLRGYF
ncbi:MAG: hypothetical protein MUP82_02730 [Candidatus Marinimicrobia bacterium]|nr:hypothetical protein [Candidatus Neomarinimicrobiota bacterium]